MHGDVYINTTSANYGNLFSSQTSNVPGMIVPCSHGQAGACLFGSEVTNASSSGQAQIPAPYTTVSNYLNSVETTVIAAITTFNTLTPTQTMGEITGNPTFNLGSTVANVISAPDINTTGLITIIGDSDPNQYVIFNLTSNAGGKAMTVSQMALIGISPTQILFNLENGDLSTSGAGNTIDGIIFAPKNNVQNDAVGIKGEVISGGNLAQFESGGYINDPLAPEPSTWIMAGAALLGMILLRLPSSYKLLVGKRH